MPLWLSTILEIIKITIPALVVFATVYVLLRQYLQNDFKVKALELKKQQQNVSLPIRLQAYERLALFCERIALPNLILRIRTESMTASDLQAALVVATRQEYEHNISQQVYVSYQLWEIIRFAMTDSISTITQVAKEMPAATGLELSRALFERQSKTPQTIIDKTLAAIRSEAATYM